MTRNQRYNAIVTTNRIKMLKVERTFWQRIKKLLNELFSIK